MKISTLSVTSTSAAIGLVLLALQIYRRLYENLFVSVFSSGHINILHYIVGHTHYLGAVTLLLAEAPGFDGQSMYFISIFLSYIVAYADLCSTLVHECLYY